MSDVMGSRRRWSFWATAAGALLALGGWFAGYNDLAAGIVVVGVLLRTGRQCEGGPVAGLLPRPPLI